MILVIGNSHLMRHVGKTGILATVLIDRDHRPRHLGRAHLNLYPAQGDGRGRTDAQKGPRTFIQRECPLRPPTRFVFNRC